MEKLTIKEFQDKSNIEQEVEELLKFVKEISSLALYFDSYLLVDFHEHLYNLDTLVKLTNDALNDAVFLINQSLDIINVLTEDDIFKIMELITSFKGTVSNEVIDIVKKVFDYYVDIIIDFEFRDGMINEDTLEILNDVYYYIVRSDLLSFIKFYTGQDIHQQDIDLFLNEIYLFIDYLFKYNFDTLIELLCSQKVTCSYVKDLNTEIFKLSNYVLDYIDNSLLEKYKVYIIDILDYNNIDVDFYQKIYDNLDGFKTYASLEFINYLNMNLCYTIGLSSYDQFLAYFNVYSKLTNEEISNATLAYVDYEKYINKRMEDEFTNLLEHEYMTNFEACMDDIESLLGTMPSSLTQKDADKIVLYNTFTLVNNNYWKFPGVVDIVLDDEREQLIVTISDGYPEYYMFDTSYTSRIEINFVLANFHIANYYFDFNVVDNTLVIDYKKIQDFVDYYQTDCIKAYINRATIGYYAGDFVTSFDDSICGYDLTSILYK